MSRYQSTSIIGLCLLSLIATLSSYAAAEQPPLRVAIVDAGVKEAVPPALLDLLTVKLSGELNIELLERQEIATVLHEQQVNLQVTGPDAALSAIQTGNILGAQALVMLWADPKAQNLQPVHVRIVETTRGIRFGRTALTWSNDHEAISKQVNSTAEHLASRLQRVQDAKGQFTVVSVAGFQCNEPTKDAHRIRHNFESWLEVWLASQPGIAVAERTKVLPLIQERNLSQDLSRALGDADAVVTGTFKIDFSQQEPQLQLRVRIIRKDQSIAKQSIQGSLNNITSLQQKLGATVLKLLSREAKAAQFDLRAEANLLTESAKQLAVAGRRCEASSRMIAAYALEPENYQRQVMILRYGVCVSNDQAGPSSGDATYDKRMLLCDVARQAIGNMRRDAKLPTDKWIYEKSSVLDTIFSCCRSIAHIRYGEREPSAEEALQHEWFRASVEDLYRRCLTLSESIDDRLYQLALAMGLDNGQYWSKTPEEAVTLRRELLERADRSFAKRKEPGDALLQGGTLRLERNLAWKHHEDLSKILHDHLVELARSDRVFLRAHGERGLAEWAIRHENDRELAIKHYQQFIDIIVGEIIPAHPSITYEVGSDWLGYYHLHDSFPTNLEGGQLWSRVISARWSHGCPRSSQPWVRRITKTIAGLEKAGHITEATTLLKDLIDQLTIAEAGLNSRQKQGSQWPRIATRLKILLSELTSRHPEQKSDIGRPPALEVDCEATLTKQHLSKVLRKVDLAFIKTMRRTPTTVQAISAQEEKQLGFILRHWHFLAIAPTDTGFVVLCGKDNYIRSPLQPNISQWLAVARLNQEGVFQSAKLYPEPIEQNENSELSGHHLWTVAVSKDDLFIALSTNGLLWFPSDAEPIHFSSRYLNQSSPTHRPAPFDTVYEMVSLEGNLYVKTGPNPSMPIIYELDYRKERTIELLNAQSLTEESPLWAREGFSLMAGPPGKLLIWAKPGGSSNRSTNVLSGDLFLFDTKEKSIRQSQTAFHLTGQFYIGIHSDYQTFKGIAQNIGIGTSDGILGIFNPKEPAIDWIVAQRSLKSRKALELTRAGIATNNFYAVASQKKAGRSLINDWKKYQNVIVKTDHDAHFDWLLYDRKNPIPRRLVALNLPPPGEVKHFLFVEERQILMLTDQNLFRVTLPE